MAAAHMMFRIPQDTNRAAQGPSQVGRTDHADFHAAFCAACPSRWLLRMREMLFIQSERYRRMAELLSEPERDVDAEHRQ